MKAEQEKEVKEEEEVAILEREVEANIAEVLIPNFSPPLSGFATSGALPWARGAYFF